MGFFDNKKEQDTKEIEQQKAQEQTAEEKPVQHVRKKVASSAFTIITEGSNFIGTINGIDSVHIDGYIKGDIIVDNGIIIGKSGRVEGNIQAKKVVVSGKLEGSVVCEDLEVMKHGRVSNYTEAITVILDGQIKGDIVAKKSIDITNNAEVESMQVSTDTLKIDGILYANTLTTRFLEITPKGFLDSNMTVDTIKIHKGGTFVGSIERLKQVEQEERIESHIEENSNL